MPIRALVIAIEDYPGAEGLAPHLEGTNDAADAFIRWLKEKKGVQPEHLRSCGAPGREGRTAGTTREEILNEVETLVREGRDTTPELYVFFSGHGLSWDEAVGRRPVDVLLAAGFTRPESSGGACLQLREFQEKLQTALGPGDHYWFVDACRNVLSEEEIEPLPLGRRFGRSRLGVGTLFTLYSTAPEQTARVDSGFSRHLVEGLNGKGRAKGWVGKQMFVTFDNLQRYVRTQMPHQQADIRIEGSSEGRIVELVPIPNSRCRIRVSNADAHEAFEFEVHDDRGFASKHVRFTGPQTEIPLPPGDYAFTVREPEALLVRRHPPGREAVDVYEPCEVEFEKQRFLSYDDGPNTGHIALSGPSEAQFELIRLDGSERTRHGTFSDEDRDVSLPAGKYAARLTDPGGRPLRERELTVEAGSSQSVDLSPRFRLPVRPRPVLGSISQEALLLPAVVLGVLGGERIAFPSPSSGQERAWPAADFSREAAGASAVYVLAYFERPRAWARIGLSGDAHVPWQDMVRTAEPDRFWEGLLRAPAGPSLLSVELAPPEGKGRPLSLSFVTHLLPDHATLFTLTEDEQGQMEVHQYILPIHSRFAQRAPGTIEYLEQRGPEVMRALWQAQDAFARKLPFSTALPTEAQWLARDVFARKWHDPNMLLLLGYEMLRREAPGSGHLLYRMKGPLGDMGALPDMRVFWREMQGDAVELPRSPPLFLDGLLALGSENLTLPLEPGRLTYEGPWVSWRNAVLSSVSTGR